MIQMIRYTHHNDVSCKQEHGFEGECGLIMQHVLPPAIGDELGLGDRHHIVMTKKLHVRFDWASAHGRAGR